MRRTLETPCKVSVSAMTTSRLLPALRLYNRYFGGYLLALFHASNDDQAAVRNQQAAVVHGGLGSVFADRFPFAGVLVKSESYRGRFGRLAVIADSVVVIGGIASSGEIDSAGFSFLQRRRTGRDAIARVAGMRWKFYPFNFRDVALPGNYARPAFAGREVLGTQAAPVLVGAVHVNDGVVDDGAGMAEHGCTGNRCGLHPGIFVGVIDLDVADCVVL